MTPPHNHALRDGCEPPDPDDPFGTRPDEKPPSGWDDRFWDDVRVRIEDARGRPEARQLPDPGRWRRHGARATGALAVLLLAAGLFAALRAGRTPRPASVLADPTVVRVFDSDRPDVEVDWARLHGSTTGFAVFRSIDPDVSYVFIDQSIPARTPDNGSE